MNTGLVIEALKQAPITVGGLAGGLIGFGIVALHSAYMETREDIAVLKEDVGALKAARTLDEFTFVVKQATKIQKDPSDVKKIDINKAVTYCANNTYLRENKMQTIQGKPVDICATVKEY